MVRKLLFSAVMAGGLLLWGSLPARTSTLTQAQAPSGQTQKAVKSVSGKIADIKDQGHSFSLEIGGDQNNAKSMDFVVDGNTTVKGKVTRGTAVIVEYQVADNGQNVAVSVTATNA